MMNDDILSAIKELKHSIAELETKLCNPISREFVTIDQLCDALHVSRMTIYRYTKDGILKPYRFGSKSLYKIEDVKQSFKET